MDDHRIPILACLLLTTFACGFAANLTSAGLRYNFYSGACGDVESIVWGATKTIMLEHENAPAQLLRLLFHDCFIEGCDASVMLDDSKGLSNGSIERQAIPNKTLKGFDYIDAIKELLEEECPGIVSCADILVLAVRDAIALSGGPYYPLLTGRRDSVRSYFTEALAEIPRPDGSISETLRLFSLRGFNERETVALLGGHHIGRISCEFIQPRLENPDEPIPMDFLMEMRMKCRQVNNSVNNVEIIPSRKRNLVEESSFSSNGRGGMYYQGLSSRTSSGGGFDGHYYQVLKRGRGLLRADQELMADPRTAEAVLDFADDSERFRFEFAEAMIKLSNLKVLVGSQGEVRRSCSALNSS